jgi:peptidoglycan hydrolase-like protein with peptidoglycan-binding domain
MASLAEGRTFEISGASGLRFVNAMRRSLVGLLTAALLAGGSSLAWGETKAKTTASSRKTTASKSGKKTSSKRSRRHRVRGQKKIDNARTREIQRALVKAHYLDEEPTGVWDAQTEAALRRYQAANGWQTKVVPDSRALIKLGLGPNHDGLMNPETAMTSGPSKPVATGEGKQ